MNPMTAISAIVPLAADDDAWRALLPQLAAADEVIVAAAAPPPPDWKTAAPPRAQWLQTAKSGRAAQMNAAAVAARGEFLWFVHADSRLSVTTTAAVGTVTRLRAAVAARPDALHYFDLRFYDGGARMRLNEWGVRLRCRVFGNPFGDQALCLARERFFALGGYDETAPYGEDHLLVLAAGRRQVPIRRIAAPVGTSARRYIKHGWWRTIRLYQKLWLAQWRQARRAI